MTDRLKSLWNDMKVSMREPTSKDDKVLIIDSLNTFIRVFASVPALNDDGMHVGGISGFLKSIAANIRQFQSTRCILVFDGAGGSRRRRQIYSDYKGNRKNKLRLNRFDEFKDLVDEQESFKYQLNRLVEYLDALPITVIAIDNIEADDTIAYITTQYYKDFDNHITIVSTDKDFIQLVSDKVHVWSPVKKKLYTPDTVYEEYGLNVSNFLLYRILDGDSSDNINGVRGVGIKKLIKRFPAVCDSKFTIDNLISECKSHIDNNTKIKLYSTILDNLEVIERNRKLMQLDDVDISASDKLNISSIMDMDVNGLDNRTFRDLFSEDRLFDSIPDMNNWLRDTFLRLHTYATR